MTSDDTVLGRRRAATGAAHLFTVRLWKAETAAGSEYRGQVRDVASGAYRHFRNWSALTDFMLARLEDGDPPGAGQTDGGTT